MRRASRLLQLQEAPVALALVALVVIFSIASSNFRTLSNINDLLMTSLFVLFVAIGMTFVLAAGGIDLSVGSVMGLGGAITGLLLQHGAGGVVALAGGLASGVVVGLLNGLVITRLRLADFMVTLASLSIVQGIVEMMTANHPINYSGKALGNLSGATVGPISVAVIYAVAITAVMAFVFRFTSFGRAVVAVGMNPRAARLSGFRVDGTRVLAYVVSGLMAALAGIFLASYLSTVQALQGSGYELEAIAAAVIGGTSLLGGKGSVWGAALGALLLGILQNGLILAGLNGYWFDVVEGVVIVAAVALGGGLQVLRAIVTPAGSRQREAAR
jgi:ribose/xylose/arabinose/galactoside ABC-type transport system permease subunit